MDTYCTWERVHTTQDISLLCSSWDCITYSYLFMSVFLFALGSVISVFSFGAFDGNVGHMWIFGPLCICSAIMVGVRNVLYLRSRRVISMVVRQQIPDFRFQQAQQQYSPPIRTVNELALPPSYEQLIGVHNEEGIDLPPPTYEEAIVGMSKEETKSDNINVPTQ